MAFMKWDDKYLVNIRVIDEQHQRLFAMINEFHELLRKKEIKRAMSELLQGLVDYSSYHFHSEESLMEQHGFPGLEQHRRAHEQFTKKVAQFQNRYETGQLVIPIEIADFLKDWLVNHVTTTDQQYAPFFKQKGVS